MTDTSELRIPKIIHYCWFGGRPLPRDVVRYMNTWRKYLPDYRIIEWNETNFNLDEYTYAREAYNCNKFAFVTDIVRLYALYNHGGIYMDTDVEIVRPLDRFLHHHAFSGFEDTTHVATAVMGSEAGGVWVHSLLKEYRSIPFITRDGVSDTTTNVDRITTKMCADTDLRLDNSFQDFESLVTLYPAEFFCPKSYSTGVIHRTRNTYAIHHFSGSWLSSKYLIQRRKDQKIYRVFGERLGRRIIKARNFATSSGLISAIRYIVGGILRSIGLKSPH